MGAGDGFSRMAAIASAVADACWRFFQRAVLVAYITVGIGFGFVLCEAYKHFVRY